MMLQNNVISHWPGNGCCYTLTFLYWYTYSYKFLKIPLNVIDHPVNWNHSCANACEQSSYSDRKSIAKAIYDRSLQVISLWDQPVILNIFYWIFINCCLKLILCQYQKGIACCEISIFIGCYSVLNLFIITQFTSVKGRFYWGHINALHIYICRI